MPALTDVHAHSVTDRYVAAAVDAGVTPPDGMPLWPDWSLNEHLAMMQHNGIDYAILWVSSPGVHFGDDDTAQLACHVNDFAAAVVAGHGDRFGLSASLPLPAVDAAVPEAVRALDTLGAAGVIVRATASRPVPQ